MIRWGALSLACSSFQLAYLVDKDLGIRGEEVQEALPVLARVSLCVHVCLCDLHSVTDF